MDVFRSCVRHGRIKLKLWGRATGAERQNVWFSIIYIVVDGRGEEGTNYWKGHQIISFCSINADWMGIDQFWE